MTSLSQAEPEKVVVAGSAVEESEIDEVFAAYNRTDSPGCATALVSAGHVAFSKGYGMANLEQRAPIRPDTVFYAGSVSKQFVAFSAALLAEAGKLSLDDNVRQYLPELPDYGNPITIRHLIHHTSGLRDYLGLWSLRGRSVLDSMPRAEVLDLIARQRELNFQPGEEYLYSNSGYFLLAEIVGRADDSSLREFSQREMFAPLGMRASHFHDDSTHVIADKAEGYFKRDNGTWGALAQRFALVGSGGLYTNVLDLARWDGNFYDNQLGKGLPSLIDTTLETGRLNSGKELDYAFGLVHGEFRGLKTVQHGGALGGYRAHLLRFPEERFSIAILCNLADARPGELADRLAELVLSDRLYPDKEKPSVSQPSKGQRATVDSSLLNEYSGRFADERGRIIEFRSDGDRFLLDWPGLEPLELLPESETVFSQTYDQDRFAFRRGNDGRVDRVVVLRGDAELPFLRIPTLSADRLVDYEGVYESPELDSTLRIFQKQGKLWAQPGYDEPRGLETVREDVFSNGRGVLIEFERESGRATRLLLQAGRVRNLLFERKN